MKKPKHGASLYYASDKNIYDALNQHKVDNETITRLFARRNTIASKKTAKEDLADYFARLTHDYLDHKDIAARLGVAPRRERVTYMDIHGDASTDQLKSTIDRVKADLEKTGDVVHISRRDNNITLSVQYSSIDYKRSEFTQIQVKDGSIEFIKTDKGYLIRNTQSNYINLVRDAILSGLEVETEKPVEKVLVTLFDVPSHKLRSRFFHDLATNLPGYSHQDVTEVYVYKQKPQKNLLDGEDDDSEDIDATDLAPENPHIERVFLRGNGVSRSSLLHDLTDGDNYYIVKIGWTASKTVGNGDLFEIEAVFTNPRDCTGFSFLLKGIHPYEAGRYSKRRPPLKPEIEEISKVIESKSRELTAKLRAEYLSETGQVQP